MKKICLSPRRILAVVALVVLLISAAVPAVSAETITGNIYDPQYDLQEYPTVGDASTSKRYDAVNTWKLSISPSARIYPTQFVVFNARISQSADQYALTENYRIYSGTITSSREGYEGVYGDVNVEYQKIKYDSVKRHAYYTVVVNLDWDYAKLNSLEIAGICFDFSGDGLSGDSSTAILFGYNADVPLSLPYIHSSLDGFTVPYSEREYIKRYIYLDTFEQSYTISTDENGINIDLIRVINGKANPSKIIVTDLDSSPIYESITYTGVNHTYSFPNTDVVVELDSRYRSQRYEIYRGTSDTGPTPDDHSVTVYVKNSQTGALIANSNIVIDAFINGEYYPVVNRTEPSGIFRVTLQPTGGGKPNPDGYRLIATADGYNNPMPEINFTVDTQKTSIYCLLDPIAGGPVNENKTFIDFFVRDMSANPVAGATVKFGKYTLITNSAGYTVFEVDKNKNYSWTVSKSGYGSLTGTAVIGSDARYTINTGIDPAVTPTKPTPIPTSTPIRPTPTMTAPTGETVSNWLEWFAAHFGMILGRRRRNW